MIFAGICLMTKDVKKLADFYKEILQTVSDDSDDDIHQEIHTKGASFAILKNEINHINTEKIEFDYCVRNVNRYPSKFIIVILLYLFRYCQANMAIYLIKIHIIKSSST